MVFRAAIVTPWVLAADDTSDAPSNHPLLSDEYAIKKWEDITGQATNNLPPIPNEYTVLAELDEDVLAAIDIDSDYDVLWSMEL